MLRCTNCKLILVNFKKLFGMVKISLLSIKNALQIFNFKFKLPSGTFFICYLGRANFGPLLRGKSHSPDFNHSVLSMFNSKFSGRLVLMMDP